MASLPQVKVTFFLYGDVFNVNDITKQLGIIPTRTREKQTFPIEKFAHTYWAISTLKESCRDVSTPFEKLIKILSCKKDVIINICDRHKIKPYFEVNIYMENGDRPEMVLTKEIICFLAYINAEMGFDLFID